MKPKAIIVLANGFEEIEAVSVIDLLKRADIEVVKLGFQTLRPTGSHGITIEADMLFEDFHQEYNALILPGGPGHQILLQSPQIIDTVKTSYEKGILCAAICAAPRILGKALILKGKKATCYPGCEDLLTEAEIVNKDVVLDGSVLTSRGPATAIAFALAIIEYLRDSQTAQTVAKAILFRQ